MGNTSNRDKNIRDVVVVGGGPAGVAAALAAARNGARTALIERYGFVGGNMAMGLPIYSFHDLQGKPVLGGVAVEIIDLLKARGGAAGPIRNGKGSIAVVDPEQVKCLGAQLLVEAGVEAILHASAIGVRKDGDVLRGVRVQCKGRDSMIWGQVFVDASGDGDLAALAGCPFSKGEEGSQALQPPSLVFRMGDVDTERIRHMAIHSREECGCRLPASGFSEQHYIFAGFRREVSAAKECGELPPNFPMKVVIFSTLPQPGEAAMNFAKVLGVDGTDAESMARGEMKARSELPGLVQFLQKRVPGFERAWLTGSAHQLGIRETRRIQGEYVLTQEDVLEARRFADAIAQAYYPIDVHNPMGGDALILDPVGAYTIPYRSLIARGTANLLVAGRCISTDHGANGSVRVMGICMATGQAAGTAAALCANEHVQPRLLDVQQLQQVLRAQGATLD